MKLNDETAKNNPFRVPEDYFDALADRTMAAIREEEAGAIEGERQAGRTGKQGRVVNLRSLLLLAAAIAGFAIMGTAIVKLTTSDSQGSGTETGSSLYADLAVEEIDTYMLEDELNMTDNARAEMPDDDISPETIIEYLMTEDIDLNEIYELL